MIKKELIALIEDAEFALEYKKSLSQTLYLMGYYIQYNYNEYNESFIRKMQMYIKELREETLFAINSETEFKKKKYIKEMMDEVIEGTELFLVSIIMTEG